MQVRETPHAQILAFPFHALGLLSITCLEVGGSGSGSGSDQKRNGHVQISLGSSKDRSIPETIRV